MNILFLLFILYVFWHITQPSISHFTGLNGVDDVPRNSKNVYYGNLELKPKVVDNFNSYVFNV